MPSNNKIFAETLSYVQKGYTIQRACKMLNLCRESFYRDLTPEQKQELRMIKSSTLIHGGGQRLSRMDLQRTLINFNHQEDEEEDL